MHFTDNKTGKINLSAFLKTVHTIAAVKNIEELEEERGKTGVTEGILIQAASNIEDTE